jgi:subtilisin
MASLIFRLLFAVALVVAVGAAGKNASTYFAPASLDGGGQAMAAGRIPLVPGQYIVVLQPGADPRAVASDHAAGLTHVYSAVFNGFAATVPDARLSRLQNDPRVLLVEPDEIHSIVDQGVPTGVDRIETDKVIDLNGGATVNIPVAVIDTGISSHADLNLAGGRNFTGGNPNNFNDGNGHGTHVAGTIGARGNSIGVVGVAPGAPLWGVKVCSNGGICMSSNIIAGIDWVADQKSKGVVDFAAANFSISSADSNNSCTNPANSTHRAICGLVNTGVVFVMAAGNDNRDKTPYPVTFSVAAVADFDGKGGGAGSPTCRNDSDDTLANFSNYSSSGKVKIAAPGVCILSTWNNGGYNTISGTSMATPHVTGAVALYLHQNSASPATSATGVTAIESAIIGAAIPRGATCSYNDSRDGGPMLFVNAGAFGGNGACDLAAAPPSPSTGTISGAVTDAVTSTAIGGATVSLNTGESTTTAGDGSYSFSDIATGTYTVTASASGYESAAESGVTVNADATTTVDFALTPSSGDNGGGGGTMTVESITYTTSGGPAGNRHLQVTLTVVDANGAPVGGASVSITLTNGTQNWSGSGTTNGSGQVTFSLNNHPNGCYTTTVNSLTHASFVWDNQGGYDDSYCKS